MTHRDLGAATTPKLIAIAVVECDDQFLVGVRPDGPLAGYWEFPGGKVRRGEAPADAAVRECWEETGVRISLGALLNRARYEYDHGLLELHFYAAAPRDARPTPRPPFRWVKRAELATLRFPPANAAVLAALGSPAQPEKAEKSTAAIESAPRKSADPLDPLDITSRAS